MKYHQLKTHPQYFQAVRAGTKKFEFRKNDRNFEVGDRVILKEYNPKTKRYTNQMLQIQITYVLKDYDGIEDGYCIFSFDRVSEPLPDNCILF